MDALPVLSTEMAIVLGLVVLTVVLFATEAVRVDVVALFIMTLLGLLIYVPGLDLLLPPDLLRQAVRDEFKAAIQPFLKGG